MNKLLLGILIPSLFLLGCKTEQEKKSRQQSKGEDNILSATEISEGWELLFDGKTFDGWRSLGRNTVQNEHWRIEDGTIRKLNSGEVPSLPDGQPVEGGDLMTRDSFDNYELYFEWKISKKGNTGVKYNVSEEMSQNYDSKYSALGFEYQLLDDKDSEYAGKLKPSQYTGGLYDLVAPKNARVNPVGEYNSSRISVNGNLVEHWLNGTKVLTCELGSPELDSLFQNSKYKDIPQFLEKRKGHIVLQNHKDDAWFKNIKIRKIPPTD
ncbi:3-keto-disaccharide hydrolase [Sinomicrobium weinanense]|uniref:DUF1080 domain-containing protein n=1 Tax=Sinomicrobium weinanense TaxID=2842200 RepID=A0A926JPQ9_9FLAO|nr:DUF1080 domain-containing protein [Sinomicrobium weinanense]MBC9795215.1 DUF1080 domain-containing protein [Sinomicrobium weinanense]MBU3121992.1 DUF1080 domain-containing protein [Sinomicrobium weinanense]